jgi:diguanylate cyclase (GGDEF)-like protein
VPQNPVQRLTLAVFTAGVFVLAAAWASVDVAVLADPVTWALAGLILVGDFLPVTVRRRGAVEHFMSSSAFAFALLLYAGPAPALTAFVLSSLVSDLRARCPWERVAFNAGQYALALAAATVVLRLGALPDGALRSAALGLSELWPLVPAALSILAFNHLVVGAVVALDQRSAIGPVLREDLGFQLLTSGVVLAIAPVIVVVVSRSLWLLPALLVPVLALHRSTKQSVADAERANHDVLTGLPNRGRFQQALRWALDEAAPGATGALLVVDLGRLGEVNETLGHRAGDQLLATAGTRLAEVAGPGATLARVGGDEFALLLPGVVTEAEALEAAQRVREQLLGPLRVDGLSFHLSPRVGVALYPRDADSSQTLLRHGDVAVHLAKRRGTGIELYSSDHDRSSRRRLQLVDDLRTAIASGAVDVHFQPKADLAGNRVVGLEALARWTHPRLGTIRPDEFIPLAERAGLVDALTRRVLDRALARIASLGDAGLSLDVAVNLSPQSLTDESLVAAIAELLERHGVQPQALHLEMTEGTLLAGEEGLSTLRALRALGVQLAVDDFGTGYSSLARLKHLPVDQLKIDKSFVRDMEHDATDAAIVRSALELARTLGMAVVAEGVETTGAWVALREMGCDQVQGFLVSRPLASEDLLPWLRHRLSGQTEPRRVAALVEEPAALGVATTRQVVTPLRPKRQS